MNPQLHAEFVELCALFYTGELSDEEWALLQIHMAYCDDCRQSFEQYKHVAKELIPSLAAAAAKDAYGPYESDASLAHAEQQLLDRVKQRSAPPEAAPAQATRRNWPRVLVPSAISALAAGVAVALLYHAWDVHKSVPERQTPTLAAVSVPAPKPSSDAKARPADSHLEIDALRRQLADASGHSESAAAALHALQVKLTEEQAQRSSLQAERDSLGTQLSSAQSDIQRLRQEVDTLHGDSKRRVDYVAELEGKVRTLNVALEESQTALDDKERMLALDKDFLAHDRDIRDLIGARNLYIADIFDTTESGKTAKPFGRIFYTQDRSLVFYGFDLEKKAGAKHAVAYQAWGSGTDRAPVSLGIFYQDDGHRRWVLRCNDARTLSRLNMVFVTVEPEGGSRTPTGQQFLRAYLQIQPNHP